MPPVVASRFEFQVTIAESPGHFQPKLMARADTRRRSQAELASGAPTASSGHASDIGLQVQFFTPTMAATSAKRHGRREVKLGEFGVWQPAYATTPEMAKRIEDLGYTALWLGVPPPDLAGIDEILDATRCLVVGSSIYTPTTLAGRPSRRPTGASRRSSPIVSCSAWEWVTRNRPGVRHTDGLAAGFLDELDEHGVPSERRALAALGPKMLKVARDRTGGAVPYLVTTEHTRQARQVLGPHKVLAPEQKVVLETDALRARTLARPRIKHPYLGLVNYTNNLRRLGFDDGDIAGDGSDLLIDQLAIHGDATAVAAGLRAHLAAGANYVQIQVIGSHSAPAPAMPGVLLQVYDEEVFQIYESLATSLRLSASASA